MPLLFSYSVRAVANSEPGLKRGIQTKDPEGGLFVFRVGGKGSVVSRRGVNGIASEAANSEPMQKFCEKGEIPCIYSGTRAI